MEIVLPVSLGEFGKPNMPSSNGEIVLPVSLGEALDKLTILDIKLEKISDERRADVQKEYNILMQNLGSYVNAFPYHYRILRDINRTLWDIQDLFHGKNVTSEQGADIARQILLENDRRFRVKAKINTLSNSVLREQKGYTKKRAFVYTHLGLGDMFWMNGAVRWLATAYDEVHVVSKNKYAANAAAMYADDTSIKLYLINDDSDLHPWPIKRFSFIEQGFDIYSCGQFAPKIDRVVYDLPNSFYDDFAMPRAIRTAYFHVPRTPTAKSLAALYQGIPYIVIHEESSVQKLPIRKKILAGESRLILDLNKNQYEPTHTMYPLAQHVVNRPLIDYTYLIESAEELYMIESSIYCMASHLDLSRVKRRVCYEPFGGNSERLGLFETGTIL